MNGLRKYAHVAATSIKERLHERSALLARLGFLLVVMLIYSRLWQSLGAKGQLRASDFVWYLAVTEWLLLSLPAVHLEVEDDVRTGRVAALLPRPISYFGAVYAKSWGELVVRLVSLGPAAFAMAYVLTGEGPPLSGRALFIVIPYGIAAASLMLACYVTVGLSAFWLHEATPVYLLWQKLAFVCGGLYMPLDIYPSWLRSAAEFTPFPSLIYEPAHLFVTGGGALLPALKLGGWALGLGLVMSIVYRRGLRTLEVGGG